MLVVTVLIASTASFFFWDFIRDTIVVPIYYLLWVTDHLIKTVPQQVYLIGVIVLCFTIALNTLRSIPSGPGLRPRPPSPPPDITRYAYWGRLYKNLYGIPFYRSQFATETRKFLLALLAYQNGTSSAQIEALVINGSLPVPAAVRDLIHYREIRLSRQEIRPQSRWRRLLFGAAPHKANPVNDQVAQVIDFIEQQLEITHAGDQ